MSLFLKLTINKSILMRAQAPKKLVLNSKCIEYKYILYVLKLEKGRYYVGKSKNEETLKQRIKNHREGKGLGAAWTTLYPVVEEMKDLYEYNRSPFQEDRKVKELMYIFGTNMVRGGTYSRTIDLSKQESLQILKEFKGATDECYNCGKRGHFIKNCPQPKDGKGKQSKKSEEFKEQKEQKKPENKKLTKEDKKYEFVPLCTNCHTYGHYKCDFNQYDAVYQKRYKQYVKCWNCNKYGHFESECDEQSSCWEDSQDDWYSDWSDSGSEVEYVERSYERSREKRIACYICGDPNHLKPDCPFNNDYKYKKNRYFTQGSFKSNTCNYCKKPGHWYADCWLRKNNERRRYSDESDDNSF